LARHGDGTVSAGAAAAAGPHRGALGGRRRMQRGALQQQRRAGRPAVGPTAPHLASPGRSNCRTLLMAITNATPHLSLLAPVEETLGFLTPQSGAMS